MTLRDPHVTSRDPTRFAHISRKQARRAHYRGLQQNLSDLRRSATVPNHETTHRPELARAA
jgi:hypothetical protein